MYNCCVGMTLVASPYKVMRRLCDSLTKRDDDKAETSRMGDDDNEVVEIDDDNEVNAMNVKVNPSGHKPCIDGCRLIQQDHTGTWKRDVI